jgi:hypothetical protein
MTNGFYQLGLVGTAFGVVAGGGNSPERLLSDLWVHGSQAYTGTYGRAASIGNALKIWQLDGDGTPALADSVIVPGIGTISDVEVSADGRLLMISAEDGPDQGLLFYSLVNPVRPALLTQIRVETGVHTATLADIGGKRYAFAVKNPIFPQVLIFDVTGLGQ